MCVCPPDSNRKYSVLYNICVIMFMYYTVYYFTGIFYAVVRQISMLIIDNKDSVVCSLMYRLMDVIRSASPAVQAGGCNKMRLT